MEFERFKQGAKMSITMYHARKVAAFHQAVPNAGASQFEYLKRQMMKGIYSPCMRLKVIEANVRSKADLLCVMVSAIANALQANMLDMGFITNLEGLASTTSFERSQDLEDKPMEVSKVSKVEDDHCYTCKG